jgi:hypothetical protein
MRIASRKLNILSLSCSVLFFAFGLCFFLFVLVLELYAKNDFLAFLGGCLGFLIIVASYFGYRREGVFSPLIVFSVMYSGYVLGGLYYSSSDESFGKFLDFLSLEREENVLLMQYGLVYAIICYLMFCFGYFIFSRRSKRYFLVRPSGFVSFFERYYGYIVAPLLVMGLAYWYWVALVAAGGLLNLIVYFQAFRHLIADTSITTLPYHFYYAGIFLWLLGSIGKSGKVGFLFWSFSFLGLIMTLTQGRITLAITFLLSQIIFIALYDSSKEKGAVKIVVAILFLAFAVYFLRIASNYLFIEKDFDISNFDFFEIIVGGGNVSDLQQLAIIFYTFEFDNSLLGASYLDWIRNSLGAVIGVSPSSVGLIIKGLYVPESSGAPTPGAIGEAYANFNFGAPILMFFVGSFFHFVRRFSFESGSLFWLLVYSVFLSRFIFIYPKVDSTMLVNFLWGITPFALVILVLYLLYLLATISKRKTCTKGECA